MKSNYDTLPSLTHDPTHHLVVTTFTRLRQTQVEGFLARCTGSHTAALFLREVLYRLSPSRRAPHRPRSTVYRKGHYWMARTREEWKKQNDISRTNLATIYRRCGDLIETDHFMFGRQRQTHYRIKFERLRELMEQDEILQACLQSDLDPLKAGQRRAVGTPERSPSLHSVCDSFQSIADTGSSGACAFVAPSERTKSTSTDAGV